MAVEAGKVLLELSPAIVPPLVIESVPELLRPRQVKFLIEQEIGDGEDRKLYIAVQRWRDTLLQCFVVSLTFLYTTLLAYSGDNVSEKIVLPSLVVGVVTLVATGVLGWVIEPGTLMRGRVGFGPGPIWWLLLIFRVVLVTVNALFIVLGRGG